MLTQMMRSGFSLLLILVLAVGCPSLVLGQNAPSEIRVAVSVLPPFVMQEGNQLTGFSVDLWEAAAARLKVKSRYQILPDVGACIDAVRSNKADIGVSGIFFTKERDQIIDYTYSTLNAGLRIMVRDEAASGGARVHPLRDWFTLLFSPSAGIWLFAAVTIVIIPGHIVWLLDRRNEDGVSPTKSYFPGIFHSMLWAFTGLLSQIQTLPKNGIARLLAAIWMFAGVVFVSLYTAQLAALLTAEQIRGDINGPSDLPGKRVGTVVSNSADYLRTINADVQVFASTDEMYQALKDGRVDALVLGGPVLSYYAQHQGKGRVKMVGPEINKNDIGFVVPLGSPLRKRVSNELLALHEDGTYQRIYDKWFGNE